MERKFLVTFASTHGSTEEIAGVIAAALRERGVQADLLPARNVRSLDGYTAIVLGAPLYIFRLHKDALRFLSRFQKALNRGVPVAVFAGGPFGPAEEKTWQEVRQQLDRELAKYPWPRPAAIEIVGGKFDPARLRFPWNLVPALKQTPPSDLRDWDAIRVWAGSLAEGFGCTNQEGQPRAQEMAR